MARSPDDPAQLAAAGRHVEAARLLEAGGRTPEAIDAYRRGAAWEDAARLLAQERHFEDAADCLLRLLPSRPTPTDQLVPGQRRAASNAALLFSRAGRLRPAVGLYMALGEHERAAEVLLRAGHREESIRAMRGLHPPDSPWPPGMLCRDLSGRDAARDAGGRPHDPIAVADDKAVRGQRAEALETLLKVPADSPGYQGAVSRVVRLAASQGSMSLKVDRFLAPFLRGQGRHAHGPAHVPTLYELARLYEDADFLDEAGLAYDALLAVDSGYLDAAARRGRLAATDARGRGDLERALAEDLAFEGGPPRQAPAATARSQGPGARADASLQAQVDSKSLALGLGPIVAGSLIADRYRVEGGLGEGGYAVVFRVTDLAIDEELALKLLVRGREDPRGLERFRQEMRLTRKLAHPNIVQVYEFGTWRNARFITMELLRGRDLQGMLDSATGPLEVDRALDLARQAFAGLGEAHRMGVVHRDVKPRNLFVCDSGRLKVMDFGIAKGEDDLEGQHTATGQVVGTPAYISPERLRSDATELGPSVDVWAMGICLYRMLTGVLPFAARHVEALFMKIMDEQPEPPSVLNRAVPPALDRLVMWLLAKDPAARCADCRAAAAALAAMR